MAPVSMTSYPLLLGCASYSSHYDNHSQSDDPAWHSPPSPPAVSLATVYGASARAARTANRSRALLSGYRPVVSAVWVTCARRMRAIVRILDRCCGDRRSSSVRDGRLAVRRLDEQLLTRQGLPVCDRGLIQHSAIAWLSESVPPKKNHSTRWQTQRS